MSDVSFLAAFAGGVLALLSPCSALLLPSFFAYAFTRPTELLTRTVLFYAGLLLTLVPLGVGSSFASRLFYGHRATLIEVAGWTIVVMGVLLIAGRGFTVPGTAALSARVARWSAGRGGAVPTVALGSVYGLAGFCSGPILGAVLTVAATSANPVTGGVLLAIYALGMAAPLFAMALVWDRWQLGRRGWLRPRAVRVGRLQLHPVQTLSGVLFLVVGALFLRYDGTAGITGAFGVGDTVDLEFAAQAWVSSVAGSRLDVVVLLVVAGAAGAVLARRLRGRRSVTADATTGRSRPRGAPEPDAAPPGRARG
ncbi:MAG: cytochrome c biogenesis CcdA family protein [Actinomycetes bacterium]